MTTPNDRANRIAASPQDAPSSAFVAKPLFSMMHGGANGASSSSLSETPRRVQELFGLLKDIQNDPRFRSRFGKEQSHAIADGLRQRLTAVRNESASLVFGFGKVGDDFGGDSSPKLLQQTLNEIKNELQKLKQDMTNSSIDGDGSSDEARDREVEVGVQTGASVGDENGGPVRATEVGNKPSEILTSVGDAEEESDEESSSDNETESSGSTYVLPKQTTQIGSDRSSDDKKPDTSPADEDSATLLEKERKRVAHLLYLNKALEAKVQTIEAQKFEMKRQLDTKPIDPGDVGTTDQACGVHNKALEEKLQRAVASLDIFKVEAANMHHEVLQLRKNEASFSQEKDLLAQEAAQQQSELSRLQTLYIALEKQAKTLTQENTELKKDLDDEKSRRTALKTRLDSAVHAAAGLGERFETQLSSQGLELKNLTEELECSEKAVSALRKELARKGSEAASLATDLRRSNADLENELDVRDQEIRKITKELASQALLHGAELENLSAKLQPSETALALLQEEVSRKERETDATLAGLRRSNVALTQECEKRDEEIRDLHKAVHTRDRDIHELKGVIMKQAISIQSGRADHEALENNRADIVSQQRKDLKACEEALEAQTDECIAIKKQYEKLQKDLAISQLTSEQIDHIVQEGLRIEREKHARTIADLDEKYRQDVDLQRFAFDNKDASMRRLLEDSRALHSQLEAKLQKSRRENAQCLALIVKMGEHQLGHTGP
jgi:hypothetical protein